MESYRLFVVTKEAAGASPILQLGVVQAAIKPCVWSASRHDAGRLRGDVSNAGSTPMKTCPNPECPQRRRTGTTEYHDSFIVCPHCGGDLTSDEPTVITKVTPSGPWRRLLISVGVLLICLAGRRIPLPTVGTDPNPILGGQTVWGILTLGVQPVLLAFVLIEWAALIVPAWRPLRIGDSAARARLNRASLILGMILALGQGMVMTLAFDRHGAGESFGAGFRLVTLLTLVGGTAALTGLARWVDREGLGGGFAVLLLLNAETGIFAPVMGCIEAVRAEQFPAHFLVRQVAYIAVLAGATCWLFSRYSLPTREVRTHPRLVSRPGCGLAPLTVTFGVLDGVSAIQHQFTPGHGLDSNPSAYFPTALVMSIGLALGFAFLFNRPDRLAWIWRGLLPTQADRIPDLKSVLLECGLFTGFVVVAIWIMVSGDLRFPDAIAVIMATGIVYDLIQEWRARQQHGEIVSVWEVHQPYAVTPVLRLLESEGIPALPQSRHLRSLLQFFGPYVPIHICVPAGMAARAGALLRTRWPTLAPAAGIPAALHAPSLPGPPSSSQ